MSKKAQLNERLRYWSDNLFAKGPGAMIAALGIVSLFIIVISALVLVFGNISPEGEPAVSFWEGAWLALMRTLDAGTMGGDEGWGFRIVMFLIPTLGGVFIISTLIGILSSGIEGKLDDLRKGRSRVIEEGHILILGWSEQIYTIVSELVAANENQSKSCIVILADRDPVEMHDDIYSRIETTGKTRLVFRSGSPMDLADLPLGSPESARAMVVLSPDTEDPDPQVIKTVLAVTNHPDRSDKPYHIVAEIREPKNKEVAQVIGKGEVEWGLGGTFVARVVAQTCRQSGLSVIYTELMDFGGDEIYMTPPGGFVGQPYATTLNAYEKNCVMGISSANGTATLNPPMDYVIKVDDQIILIAEDDDKIFLDGKPVIDANVFTKRIPSTEKPEDTLVLGWNWRGAAILKELDNYVAPGSTVQIIADRGEPEKDLKAIRSLLKNMKYKVDEGDTTDRNTLEELFKKDFDHVILLSYDELETQQSDARTLITLLHLRDMAETYDKDYAIVSEMLDIRNRNLADVTRADDFIVSDKLVSLMMAQITENKRLHSVFEDMFDPEGAEIYLKPVEEYVTPGKAVNFYTVVEAARKHGETAIGYSIKAESKDSAKSYGVHLNPVKSTALEFAAGDRIVVLAEE